MPLTPYVVGQWVRGPAFYGREPLLQEILGGPRNCVWLLGTRRIGKTSILKELEQRTSQSPELGFFPLYWDFQGAEEEEDLHEGFAESLLDAADRLEELGIDLGDVERDDLFSSLTHLRRHLRRRNRALLLLGDEVEELVSVHARAPRFLRRLRRAMQSAENIRTVLASKIKLWDLAYEESSSEPFLHGFTPPLFVYGLETEDARNLVRQSKLPAGSRPALSNEDAEEICRRCNNHPYLMQVLGERFVETGDLETAIAGVADDPMVSHFFAVDFEMLSNTEQRLIRLAGEEQVLTDGSLKQKLQVDDAALRSALLRIEHLGFVTRSPDGGLRLENWFFKRWFLEQPGLHRWRRENEHPTMVQPVHESRAATTSGGRLGGRYELAESLGKGTTGEVFRAFDTLLKTTIAVKVLKSDYCTDSESRERLRREVLLSRDLAHENILKIYHLGEDEGVRYVTMRYVAGVDLATLLSNTGRLPIQRALEIVTQLASALNTAHRANVLHRDVKPSNILMDVGGVPRMTDFGLARLVGGPSMTRSGMFIGTPAYASPEQIRGEALDGRSDLYALGVVLFEMVTGRRPFVGDLAREVLLMHLSDEPPDPREVRDEVSAQLSEIILRLLAKDREDRYQTAYDLLLALQSFACVTPSAHIDIAGQAPSGFSNITH